jgi:hypothetical protein
MTRADCRKLKLVAMCVTEPSYGCLSLLRHKDARQLGDWLFLRIPVTYVAVATSVHALHLQVCPSTAAGLDLMT